MGQGIPTTHLESLLVMKWESQKGNGDNENRKLGIAKWERGKVSTLWTPLKLNRWKQEERRKRGDPAPSSGLPVADPCE